NHPNHITKSKIAFLESEGCFSKPDHTELDQLIATYFNNVHPALPIIDYHEFCRCHNVDGVPWLLLHSICFAALTHGSLTDKPSVVRRNLRAKYYQRAKLLVDIGYETQQITLVQSAILLSFWSGQSTEYWNAFDWLNTAVNIAESLGINRAISLLEADSVQRALWRRIWWILAMRDTYCAVLLGKPLRINLSNCEIEPLNMDDFDFLNYADNDVNFIARNTQVLYALKATELSLLLREILVAKASNSLTPTVVNALFKRLQRWHSSLPSYVSFSMTESSQRWDVLPSSLALLYYNSIVYLQQVCLRSFPILDMQAQEAVNHIVDIGASLVTQSIISEMPQDSLGGLFVAMIWLLSALHTKTGDEKLYKAQLRICEMSVYHVQGFWDHADWILCLCANMRHNPGTYEVIDLEHKNGLSDSAKRLSIYERLTAHRR
ncbi:fungal-specific transcription factor domain-containing protein, partial [Lipomyces doorenjongii]